MRKWSAVAVDVLFKQPKHYNMLDQLVFDVERNYTPESRSIFLQHGFGLLDSIHRPHPELFDLYKKQKRMDWDENEFNLAACRVEFQTRPKHLCDKVLNTLAWQWEGDSVAAHSIAPVVAPFVSDDDAWLAYQRISDNEALHALSYSEIVKLGLGGDASVRMKEILANQASMRRLKVVASNMSIVKVVGAKLTLGMIERNSDEAIDAALLFSTTLLGLERLQFMESFAVTFGTGELGAFMPIVETVQKIAADEWTVHIPMNKYVITNERTVPRSVKALERIRPRVEKMYDEIIQSELEWSRTTLHADGKEMTGLPPKYLEDWLYFGVTDVYNTLGWKNPHREVYKNPLPFMDDWLNINTNQGSPQEKRGGNYLLGGVVKSNQEAVFDVSDI